MNRIHLYIIIIVIHFSNLIECKYPNSLDHRRISVKNKPTTFGVIDKSSRIDHVSPVNDLKKSSSILDEENILDTNIKDLYDHHGRKNYNSKAAQLFKEEEEKEFGGKSNKGFSKDDLFEHALNDKYGKGEQESLFHEDEGEKKAHNIFEDEFANDYLGHEGQKTILSKNKDGHKKGKKKKGFHKVHHKDEYKADEIFYDEEHKLGDKYEQNNERKKHLNKKGKTGKKITNKSGHHIARSKKKGHQDKGNKFSKKNGYRKHAGNEEQHKKRSQHKQKKNTKIGRKHASTKKKGDDGY